jgi:hypothetical protein
MAGIAEFGVRIGVVHAMVSPSAPLVDSQYAPVRTARRWICSAFRRLDPRHGTAVALAALETLILVERDPLVARIE